MPNTASTRTAPSSRLGNTGRRAVLGAWVVASALLGGCAHVIRLDNDVRSYATWPADQAPRPGDRFRFERLPSQREGSAAQEQSQLEQWTEAALVKVGLVPAAPAAQPRWTVQVQARGVQLPHAPWENPRDRWPGWGLGGRERVVNSKGQVVVGPVFMNLPMPYYQRELTLVVRDGGNGQVVYETQAAHDGPWPHSPALWSALLDAALEGFPTPPQGLRRVVLEVQ